MSKAGKGSSGRREAGRAEAVLEAWAQPGKAVWQPWAVLDVDVANPIEPQLVQGLATGTWGGAWILLRVFEEPVGSIKMGFNDGAFHAATLVSRIPVDAARIINDRLRAAGRRTTGDQQVPVNGYEPIATPKYLSGREAIIESGPAITAVVCTRNHPEGLSRCLSSLQRQSYPRAEVLVVDNASTTDAARTLVSSTTGNLRTRYIFEPAAGLSRARNRSLSEVRSPLVAWIDDDEVADPHWLSEIVRAFVTCPQASAVCGVMTPAELVTQAQWWFEDYGGHSKGRGFTPTVFSPETRHVQSPLFPLPPFGTGGNMAMRSSVVRELGGFDRALGAGTATMGGEDTRALTEILLRGGTVVYQPTAVTRHFHRRDIGGLRQQLRGYGTGLSAFYTSLIIDRPSLTVPLVRMAPHALRELRDPNGTRLGSISRDFPAEILREHRRGMAKGPLSYLRERVRGKNRSV